MGSPAVHDIPGSRSHAGQVESALNRFCRALTEQYQRMAVDSVLGGQVIPAPAHQSQYAAHDAAASRAPFDWDYFDYGVALHVAELCPVTQWFHSGRVGDGTAIACTGSTGPYSGKEVKPTDGHNQGYYLVPATVDCRMAELLAACEDWAWQDRAYVLDNIPMFADHDIDELKFARDTLLEMSADFGGQITVDGGGEPSFQTGLSLSDKIDQLRPSVDDTERLWRADWTGTAATSAAEGFFATPVPTFNNHAVLASWLADLINYRATIINTTRDNALELIDAATVQLGGQTVTTDLRGFWRAVGLTGELAGSLKHPAIKAIGVSFTVVAWLGEKFLGEFHHHEFPEDPAGIAAKLVRDFARLRGSLRHSEVEYHREVSKLRTDLNAVPAFWLELYDLTENAADGTDEKADGYTVRIEDVLSLAQCCYEAAEEYNEVRVKLGRTDAAEPSVSGDDGQPTTGDAELLSILDEFAGYLTTTVARYIVAGDQLHDNADVYTKSEDDQRDAFEAIDDDWQELGVSPPDVPFDPTQAAQDTDRPGDATDSLPENVVTEENPGQDNK